MDNIIKKICFITLVGILLLSLSSCDRGIVYPQIQTNSSHAVLDPYDPEPVTFDELFDRAVLVVCADVTDVTADTALLGADVRQTDCAQLRVQEVLKGDVRKGDRLWVQDSFYQREIRDESGTGIETLDNGWSGEPLMKKGNRVVVFLEKADVTTVDGKTCYVVAPYAKYYLDRDGLYHCSLLYSSFFLNYFYSADDVDGIGVVPTDLVPKTLAELQAFATA